MSLNTGSTECHRHRQWIITLYYLLQEREILSVIFFSLDLNKTLVRYPTFLFVRSFFMSLIKLIGLQENLLKCGLFCCNCSAKSISNQYLITGFTFNFVFLHKLSLVRLGIYLLGIESSQIMASDTFQHINVLGIGLYLQLKLIAFFLNFD